ncbi:MAG TPA: hypothetical protein VEB21_18220 [Terriglobales bacterium]|nr:hypothetical protein [Terriglobales bacterium]
MRYVRCLSLALAVALSPSAALAEEDFRELFLEHQRALVGCSDVPCFRALIQQFGSKRNIANFSRADDETMQRIFDRERQLAQQELAQPERIAIDATVDGDHATLLIKSRLENGMASSDVLAKRLMVREDGIWKIGEK